MWEDRKRPGTCIGRDTCTDSKPPEFWGMPNGRADVGLSLGTVSDVPSLVQLINRAYATSESDLWAEGEKVSAHQLCRG